VSRFRREPHLSDRIAPYFGRRIEAADFTAFTARNLPARQVFKT
jgi:hypothetical protein